MKITLTPEKVVKIKNFISKLFASHLPTIRGVAQAIGYIVSSLPAVKCWRATTVALNRTRPLCLQWEKGDDFGSPMHLSAFAVAKLQWWLTTLPTTFNFIHPPMIDYTISFNASLIGWGAVMNNKSNGVHWQPD